MALGDLRWGALLVDAIGQLRVQPGFAGLVDNNCVEYEENDEVNVIKSRCSGCVYTTLQLDLGEMVGLVILPSHLFRIWERADSRSIQRCRGS